MFNSKMKKRNERNVQKVLLVMILLGFVAYGSTQDYKKQIDLLHQEVNYFIPQTFGMKPPKVDNNMSLINRINHTSGPSGVIEKFGLSGESLTLLKPTKDDIIIEDTVVIDYDTTIYDDIFILNDGQLIVRDCSFFYKGNIMAFNNSQFLVENANFIIQQDFIYQCMLIAVDSAVIDINHSQLNSANFPLNGAVTNNGSFLMDSVDMDRAFITFGIWDKGLVNIRHSDRAGEFVILGDSARLSISNSDTVLVWLGFPEGSSGELHGSPEAEDWVEQFTYPDTTCTGITYTIEVDSLYNLMLSTMAMDSTNVTVYDADLIAAGNIFEIPIFDTISGLVDGSCYDDWIAPLPERTLRLVNTSVNAWNLYFFGKHDVALKSSIFGECLTSDSARTTLMNTTCDGHGGHIGGAGSSFLISIFTTLYTDALMQENSISFFLLTSFMSGHLIAENTAVSVIYNTILANPIQIYDSATVLVTGLYPPSPAYIDDTLFIQGSATIVRGPYSQFEYEGYRVEYASSEDTTQYFPLTEKILTPVDDGELCPFITDGLDVGDYIIRLWYFFSAFGANDSFAFDNTIYLSYPYGTADDTLPLELSFTVNHTILSSAVSVCYNIPEAAKIELSIYNVCGQKVSTLDKGLKKAGEYSVIWNADDISDGVYFCRLKVGDKLLPAKKMVILR